MALLRLVLLALCLCFVLNTVAALPGRNKKNGKRNGGGRRSKKVNGATKKNGGGGGGLVTCPGFAGYCSESYPGDTCLVVCAFGRNNVPVCQEDGTWTDEPRCIEHEPGKAEQVPGTCPGVPGYCSLDLPGGLCTFECARGKHIRSSCLPDGTWDPYPTCDGDVRETKDGCDPCPGPFGGPRNRTAEAAGRGSSGGARPSSGGSSRGSSQVRNSGGNRATPRKNSGGARRNSGGAQRNSVSGGARRNSAGGGARRNSGGARRNSGGNKRTKGGNRRNNSNGRPQSKNNSRGGGGGCPDSVLEACIDACPGASPKIFGTCVAGCSKRCQ